MPATTDNAIAVLKRAEAASKECLAHINAVNTDRGSQFYAIRGARKSKGISRFERYLDVRRIKYIPSKRNNPQTNGK